MNLSKLSPIVWVILFILILTLGSATYYLYTQIESVKSNHSNTNTKEVIIQNQADGTKTVTKIEKVDTCGDDCKEEIDIKVAEVIAELELDSSTPRSDSKALPLPTKALQTTYIPLSVTATTTSTNWVDVSGAEAYVHKYSDYGEDAYIEWEASLKVAHGNGTAFARLYDDTHKIAVDGSEISTVNNSDFKRTVSGNLPFWNGNNLYKVQIKSLNGFEVTYTSGRIKIVY